MSVALIMQTLTIDTVFSLKFTDGLPYTLSIVLPPEYPAVPPIYQIDNRYPHLATQISSYFDANFEPEVLYCPAPVSNFDAGTSVV